MKRRHPSIVCCCLIILTLSASHVSGLMIVHNGGHWPNSWPQELEPLRSNATTGDFMSGSHATYYYIKFDTRDQFERAWPALLKLKSKGAPLTLHTVDPPKTDPNDKRVYHSEPQAAIVCPTSGFYQKMPDGHYVHHAEWTQDIEPFLTDGVLPQFVGRPLRQDPNAPWTIVNTEEPDAVRKYWPYEQARVELTLYVDGYVIDLNRIRLPGETPIRDHRKLETGTKPAHPKSVRFEMKQRSTMPLPRSDAKVLITIDDITAGQVLMTLSQNSGQTIVATRSIRRNDVVTFSADGRLYKLKLKKLTNVLLGDDTAHFELSPVTAESKATLSETAKIEKLILSLQQLKGAKFVRNADEHSTKKAVAHMRNKWASKKADITTAEDFIRTVGSKSTVTGQPYVIKLPDGSQIKSEDWFRKQLAKIETLPNKCITAEKQ